MGICGYMRDSLNSNVVPKRIVIYTDGACLGNPGHGGAGIVMISGKFRKEFSIYLDIVTNNIAELSAIKIALEKIKRVDYPVDIYSDSMYAIGVLTGLYKINKNKELIAQIQTLFQQIKNVEFHKIDGHSGIPENERADYLAVSAANRQCNDIENEHD